MTRDKQIAQIKKNLEAILNDSCIPTFGPPCYLIVRNFLEKKRISKTKRYVAGM